MKKQGTGKEIWDRLQSVLAHLKGRLKKPLAEDKPNKDFKPFELCKLVIQRSLNQPIPESAIKKDRAKEGGDKKAAYELAERILDKIRFPEESFKAITKVRFADEKAQDLNLNFFSGAAELLADLAVQMNELANILPAGKEGEAWTGEHLSTKC